MRREENDPLPFRLWLAQLEELSVYGGTEAPENEDRAVYRAFHLSKLAMPVIRTFSNPDLTEAEVELALERSGAEAAMRLVLGNRANCKVASAEQPSRYRASVSYDAGHIAHGEGNSPALAIVNAWSNLLSSPK